jgi:hypothetical protein
MEVRDKGSGSERVTIAIFFRTKRVQNREELVPILLFCPATLTSITYPLPRFGHFDDADVGFDGSLINKGFS